MMRAGPKGPPVPKKHAFLFCFSLQAGVILYTATVFVVRVTAVLYNVTAVNQYASGVQLAFSFIVVLVFTTGNVVSLIFVSTGAFLARITKFGNFFLLTTECIWLVMSILGFIPQATAYLYVCVDDRCPSTQWILNEGYRWDITDCQKPMTESPPGPDRERQIEGNQDHVDPERNTESKTKSNATTATTLVSTNNSVSPDVDAEHSVTGPTTGSTTNRSIGLNDTTNPNLGSTKNLTETPATNNKSNTTTAVTKVTNTTTATTRKKASAGQRALLLNVVYSPPMNEVALKPNLNETRLTWDSGWFQLEARSKSLQSIAPTKRKMLELETSEHLEEYSTPHANSDLDSIPTEHWSTRQSSAPTEQDLQELWSEPTKPSEAEHTLLESTMELDSRPIDMLRTFQSSGLSANGNKQEPWSGTSEAAEVEHTLPEWNLEIASTPAEVGSAFPSSGPPTTQNVQKPWTEPHPSLEAERMLLRSTKPGSGEFHLRTPGSTINAFRETNVEMDHYETEEPTKKIIDKSIGPHEASQTLGDKEFGNTRDVSITTATEQSNYSSTPPDSSPFGPAGNFTNLVQREGPNTSATNPQHHIIRIMHKLNDTTKPPLQGIPKFVYTDIPNLICYLYPFGCRTKHPGKGKRHLVSNYEFKESTWHSATQEIESKTAFPPLSKVADARKNNIALEIYQTGSNSVPMGPPLLRGVQYSKPPLHVINFKQGQGQSQCRHYTFKFLWALTLMCVWIGFTAYGQYTTFMFEKYYLRIEGE